MKQLSLFSPLRQPPVSRNVDAGGHVIPGEPDETLVLPHPKLAWALGRIELHQHTDGLWMWSTSRHADQRSSGYKVGPKWGRFAHSRDDALHYAVEEMEGRLGEASGTAAAAIISWARGLQ